MEKTQTGSHRARIDPHESQDGSLTLTGFVTGGTGLEKPDPTSLRYEQHFWPK